MPDWRRDAIERTRRSRHAAAPGGRRWFTRARILWAIAGVLILLAVLTIAKTTGFVTASHPSARPSAAAPSPPPIQPPTLSPAAPTVSSPSGSRANGSAALAFEFAQLEKKLHATIGVAFSAVGSRHDPMTLGDWQSGPAWSTMKVPLVITAYRAEDPPRVTDTMKAAITESDNAAAESIWEGLGDPVIAAHKVEAILREAGDNTTVQSQKVRPEYTAFGQTIWSLTNEARFTAFAVCDNRNAPIFTLMGQVEPDQSWGIGGVPGTQFKGGWGPARDGQYLVRQIGIIKTPTGRIAVAIAAQPASGSFADGTHDLTEVAHWLTDHIGELPAGECLP